MTKGLVGKINISVRKTKGSKNHTPSDDAKRLGKQIVKAHVVKYNNWNDIIVSSDGKEYNIKPDDYIFDYTNYPTVTMYYNVLKRMFLDVGYIFHFNDRTRELYTLFPESAKLKGYVSKSKVDDVEHFIPTSVEPRPKLTNIKSFKKEDG